MVVAGVNNNVITFIIDVDDAVVLRRALECTDLSMFEGEIIKLREKSILTSELDYLPVVGQAITCIAHLENSIAKFKQGEFYKKALEEAEITTPVN